MTSKETHLPTSLCFFAGLQVLILSCLLLLSDINMFSSVSEKLCGIFLFSNKNTGITKLCKPRIFPVFLKNQQFMQFKRNIFEKECSYCMIMRTSTDYVLNRAIAESHFSGRSEILVLSSSFFLNNKKKNKKHLHLVCVSLKQQTHKNCFSANILL